MALQRRRPLADESEPLQPVFHAMDPATAGPRYGSGGCRTTVWKTYGPAFARAIRYPYLRARNPAPECEMKKEQNKALLGTTHKLPLCTPFRTVHTYGVQPVGRPQNADVVLIYMRGQAVRTTLNENVMARL